MKHPFIVGDRIYLRGLESEDMTDAYLQWFNDEEVCRENSHHRFPNSRARVEAYLEHTATSDDTLVLAIREIESEVHIGNIALQNIDTYAHSAEYAVILGEKEYWNSGYGLEASKLILKHGFEQLNLRRVYLGTPENNIGMLKLARALGMKEEGRKREAFYKNGRYEDVILFGLLRHEFSV